MNFRLRVTNRFERCVKNFKRRFPKITKDVSQAVEQLESNSQQGTIIPDDYNIRKMRVASSDMQRGKSGGFRLLYRLSSDDNVVDSEDNEIVMTLLYLYAKVDQSDVAASFLEILNEDALEGDDTEQSPRDEEE
jgi:mRNA-degrading endonuclease RelE of RelBE toxin-antitoxin system